MVILIFCLTTLLVSGCDLTPMRPQLERSWVIDTMDASSDACLIRENCFSGSGLRTLLRFDSHVHNQGYSDCTVGWTPSCPRGDDSNIPDQYPFHYDTCHKHWHLTGFSRYHLTDRQTGQVVASGEKNGLCLMDVACSGGRKYTCQNQGISSGCTDVYDKGLDCQWVDITGIDTNKIYEFTWEINPSRFVKETNYNNNILTLTINLATVPRRSVRNSPAPNQCPIYSNTSFRSGSAQSIVRGPSAATRIGGSYSTTANISPTGYSGSTSINYNTPYGSGGYSGTAGYSGYSGYSGSGGYGSGYSGYSGTTGGYSGYSSYSGGSSYGGGYGSSSGYGSGYGRGYY